MKRIVIYRDKTMLGLVLVSLALQIRGNIAGMLKGAFITPLTIMVAAGMVVLHLVMISRLVLVVRFKKDRLSVGLLGLQSTPYTLVNRVSYGEKIELYFNIKSKKMPIRVMALEDNEEKYREIMEELKARCGAVVDVNRTMANLKSADKRRYKSGDAVPKIKGWLKLLMVWIIGAVVLGAIAALIGLVLLLLLPLSSDQSTEWVLNIISLSITWPFALIAMITALRKRKVAILWLCIYLWATLFTSVGSDIYKAIFVQPMHGIMGYINLVLGIIGGAVIALIVIRYLRVSKRVERTFIYERYTKGSSRKGVRTQQPMAKWKIVVLVLVVGLVLFIGFKGIQYYNSIDMTVYGSVDEIVKTKYGDEEVQPLQAGDFSYIIVKDSRHAGPYWQRDDGLYICINEWHKETLDAREVFEIIDTDTHDILGLLYVYNHDNKYSMLIKICRYNLEKGVQVVDNFGEIMPNHMYGDDYYIKVMDKDSLPEDYLLEVKVGDEVVYSAKEADFQYGHRRREE